MKISSDHRIEKGRQLSPTPANIQLLTDQLAMHQRIIKALLKERKLYSAGLREKSRENRKMKAVLAETGGVNPSAPQPPNPSTAQPPNPSTAQHLHPSNSTPYGSCPNCARVNSEAKKFEKKVSAEIESFSALLNTLIDNFVQQKGGDDPILLESRSPSLHFYKANYPVTFRDSNQAPPLQEEPIHLDTSSSMEDELLRQEKEKIQKYRNKLKLLESG